MRLSVLMIECNRMGVFNSYELGIFRACMIWYTEYS